MAVQQAFSRFAGAFLGQAEGAALAEVHQVGEPFRAGLAVAGGGAGDAAAEFIDPGRLGRTLMFTQVGELPAGVCGERGRRGAIRDAVEAGGLRGGHQIVADGLADPGAKPCGEPGAGRHGGQ